jgi:plasmid stabilization system protein ParE
MKTDDFEKQLQEQPMRQVPGHWRGEILQAARRAENPEAARAERRTLPAWLHQLLWPNPVAWGALAAVWVVVLFLNASSRGTDVQIAKVPNQPREVMIAVKQQLKFRAELMSANDVPVAEPPKLGAPQSRLEPSVQITMV